MDLQSAKTWTARSFRRPFIERPEPAFIPSWEDIPGRDGCHPSYTRLDPAAARETLEQLAALGYIESPDPQDDAVVSKTIRELRFNLAQSYQDDHRHAEAREIFRELHAADPDEQRFAVRLFVSCQALGMHDEMRSIVDELEGRRKPAPVINYLKAQVLTAEKRYEEALAELERVTEAHLMRPGLFLHTAHLYLRLGRADEAQSVYEKALAIDPDNAPAQIGLCRMALRRRDFGAAAQWALEALQRAYHHPQAHFLLGLALTGMREYKRAAEAFRAAISFNPNYPEAHIRLARLLESRLGDVESAQEHRRLAASMRM